MTIDDSSPALSESDDNGDRTAPFTLTNKTEEKLGISAVADGSSASCEISLDTASLSPGSSASVEATVPDDCLEESTNTSFVVEATGAAAGTFPIEIGAVQPEEPAKPDWDALDVFVKALCKLGLIAIVLTFAWWLWGRFKGTRHGPFERLKHLDTTWSLDKSWASNATVAAALLTPILGSSETVKTVLGENADSSIALATVGAAIAAAFIGLAPLWLYLWRMRADDGKYYFTTIGMVGAGVLTLTGAFGEMAIVYETAKELDLGGVQDDLKLWFIAGAALLLGYGVKTGLENLRVGTTDLSKPPKPSDTLIAAAMIVHAIKKSPLTAKQYQSASSALEAAIEAQRKAEKKEAEEAAEKAKEEGRPVPAAPPPAPRARPQTEGPAAIF